MISVCMATFNAGEFLEEQINSILIQMNSEDELVISDNLSTDGTWDKLVSFDDSRVRLYRCSIKGVNANFNNALSKCKGDYIFISDQDDVWMPKKISTCLRYLKSFDCVLHDVKIFDTSGVLCNSYFRRNNTKLGTLYNLRNNGFMGCAMALNRKVLTNTLPIPEQIPLYDWWIGLIASLHYDVGLINEPLILHRKHNNYSSTSTGKSRFSAVQRVSMRLIMVRHLFFKYLLK